MNVEFCGLPGCGKSYIIESLLKNTTINDYSLLKLYSENTRSSLLVRKLNGIKRRIRILSPLINEEKTSLDEYLQIYPVNERTKVFYRILLEELLDIKTFYQKYDFIFCNEGIVQSLSSMGHGYVFTQDIDNVIQSFDEHYYYNVQTIIFKCYTDRETNIKRIRSRKRSDDRFISSDIEKINAALDVKEKNINYILQKLGNVNVIDLDSTDCDNAIEKIIRTLGEHGYELHARNI